MGATCVKAKLRNNETKRQNKSNSKEIETRRLVDPDYDALIDYPNLAKVKGIKSMTAFTEQNKQGSLFPDITS